MMKGITSCEKCAAYIDGSCSYNPRRKMKDYSGHFFVGCPLPDVKKIEYGFWIYDDYGYAIIQLITLEEGTPVFQSARLLCVQPSAGKVNLQVVTGKSFVPALGQELAILAQHDVPCGLTLNILNEENHLVRRMAFETPSRPQQLSPSASSFYWDGKTNDGEYAPAGAYTVQVKTYIGDTQYTCQSEPFLLEIPVN